VTIGGGHRYQRARALRLRSGSSRKYRPQLPISRWSWHGENCPPGAYGVCEVRCVLPSRPAGLPGPTPFLLRRPIPRPASGPTGIDGSRVKRGAGLRAHGYSSCAAGAEEHGSHHQAIRFGRVRDAGDARAPLYRKSSSSDCGDCSRPSIISAPANGASAPRTTRRRPTPSSSAFFYSVVILIVSGAARSKSHITSNCLVAPISSSSKVRSESCSNVRRE
jgi:hypothetical protein